MNINQGTASQEASRLLKVATDGRTYEYVVGLRAVTSTDGMTADFYPFDMKFLGETACASMKVKR